MRQRRRYWASATLLSQSTCSTHTLSLSRMSSITLSYFSNIHSTTTSTRRPIPSFLRIPPPRFLSLHPPSHPKTCISAAHSATGDTAAFDFPRVLVRISASVIFLLGLGAVSLSSPLASAHASAIAAQAAVASSGCDSVSSLQGEELDEGDEGQEYDPDNLVDEELRKAFEIWKSKTYALTVPLKIISVRNSMPPSWAKDFTQSQETRSKLKLEGRGTLDTIFSELLAACSKGKVDSKSVAAADLVTIGDSWLNLAIKKGLIEPIPAAESQDWFQGLPDKWKILLRRNCEGLRDPNGRIWAVPYRWGSMVIMYKRSKFRKLGLHPIVDWDDLWRPELAGKISMVDSPREVIGAVLKQMGASYNLDSIDNEVCGGMSAVLKNLAVLVKQVRLFDSTHYLKAFAAGDVWVAVGWSSDILPAARRTPDVAVVVPKSGASLWADLWAVPATTKLTTRKVGGRIRGPSPLIHQWLDFCLQPARELPFKQGVVTGASPSSLEHASSKESLKEFTKGAPALYTNLVAEIPPPDILDRCEFLEPLSDSTLKEYQLLISGVPQSNRSLTVEAYQSIAGLIVSAWRKVVRQNS